jgi:nitrogen regulatory protein P-II 1
MSSPTARVDTDGPWLVKVQAVIRAHRLDEVVQRLVMIGVRGLTVRTVGGAGAAEHPRQVFRGVSFPVPFVPQIVLEWVGPDSEADAVVRAIEQRAHTGKVGDGHIVVQWIDDVVRIRTGERGGDAV